MFIECGFYCAGCDRKARYTYRCAVCQTLRPLHKKGYAGIK